MLEQIVTVVEKKGYFAYVEAEQASACSACSSQANCASATLSKLFVRPNRQILIFDQLNLQIGEQAVLGISPGGLLRAAFYAYLLPVLIMLVTAMHTTSRGYSETAVMLLSISSLLLGLLVIRWAGQNLVGGLGRVNFLCRVHEKPHVRQFHFDTFYRFETAAEATHHLPERNAA